MNDPFASGDDLLSSLDALGDLERNTDQAVLAKRSSERLNLRTPIRLRPGNASQRFDMQLDGFTADVSRGGTQVLLKRPVLAGDYFFMSFADHTDAIGEVLARCMRCRMVQEEVFEAGLQFEHDIDPSLLLPKREMASPASQMAQDDGLGSLMNL